MQNALENAGVAPEEVELVIMATSSPDDLFGDAAFVARECGATGVRLPSSSAQLLHRQRL